MAGLLGPSEGLDPATPVEGLGLLSDVEVPGPFKRGLRVGVQNLKSIGGGILQYAGRATGYGALERKGQEIGQAAAEESAPYQMRVEDVGTAFDQGVIPGLKSSADLVAYTIGNQIPMLATAAAGGILGRVAAGAFGATRAAAGLSAAEKATAVARAKAGIGSAADVAVRGATRAADIGAGLGVGAASTAMELGQIAPEGLKPEHNAPLTQIAIGSLISGATDTVIPVYLARKLGLIGAAERVLTPRRAGFGAIAGGAGKTALKVGAGEAVQETAQSYIERASANQALTGPEANSDAVNSLVMGGIMGLVTGGLAGGVQSLSRPKVAPVQETPLLTEREQAPVVNTPTATPEEQRATATQQMADLSAQVDQARAAQAAAGERLKALADERKKDFKERRPYPEIDAERKTLQDGLRESKKTAKVLEDKWHLAKKTVTDLTPVVNTGVPNLGTTVPDLGTTLQDQHVAATQAALAAGDRVASLDAEIAQKGKQAPKALKEQRATAMAEQKAAQTVVDNLAKGSYLLRSEQPVVAPEAPTAGPTVGLEPQIPGTVAEAPVTPEIVTPEQTTPEMIAAVRQQLQDQGFSADHVAALTPEQAGEALKNASLHPVNVTPAKAVENIRETMAANPDISPDQAHALNTLNFSELAKSALDEKIKTDSVERIKTEYGAPVGEFVDALPPTAAEQRGGRIADAMRDDVAALVGIKIDSLTPERRAKVLPEGRAHLEAVLSSAVALVVERALALPTIGAQQAALKRWIPPVLKGKILKTDAETFAKSLAEKVGSGTLYSKGAIETEELSKRSSSDLAGLEKQTGDDYVAGKMTFEEFQQRIDSIIYARIRARTREVKGSPARGVAEIFPGFKQIPVGIKVRAVHGLTYTEPTIGTVTGHRQLKNSDGMMEFLPTVDFGDGKRRTLTPGDIKEVFAPRLVSESRAALTQDEFDILPTVAKYATVDEWNRIQIIKGTRIREEITRIVGDDPDLVIKTFQATADSPIGSYTRVDKYKAVIAAALNASDSMSLAAHEGFHYAEDRLLTNAERTIIGNAVKEGRPLMQALIERTQRYDRENKTNITDEVTSRPAEARAYAFQFWRLGELQADGVLLRVFRKLQEFFERIANSVRGLGFRSIEDVFAALDRGQFAERGGREQYGLGQGDEAFVSAAMSEKIKEMAGWTKDRVRRLLSIYAYGMDENKSKAYAVMMSPVDFLALTSTERSKAKLVLESKPLDINKLAAEEQEIYLDVYMSGKNQPDGTPTLVVRGHEGRHRMIALAQAGVLRAPVTLNRGEGRQLTNIPSAFIAPQNFGAGERGTGGVVVNDLIPVNYANKSILESMGAPAVIQFSQSGQASWYRSALTTAVTAMPTKAASAQGWKEQIKGLVGKNDVKQVEIDAVGLNEFLDFVPNSPIYEPGFGIVEEVRETGSSPWEQSDDLGIYARTKGELEMKRREINDNPKYLASVREQLGSLASNRFILKPFDSLDLGKKNSAKITKDQVVSFLKENGVRVEEVELGSLAGRVADREARSEALFGKTWMQLTDAEQGEVIQSLDASQDVNPLLGSYADSNQPKFSQWQLPGGTNYRELALYLPTKKNDQNAEITVEQFRNKNGGTDYHVYANGKFWIDVGFGSEAQALKNAKRLWAEDKGQPEGFRSPFGHKMGGAADVNRLAHIRFNERIDSEGQRTLFIEELQSDWAQKGKKEGFNNAQWLVEFSNGDVGYYSTEGEARSVAARNNGTVSRGPPFALRIPSAPFVTKTEAWVALSLKRMIRYAAENGYQKISWTTGAQQVERYSDALRKAVDSIEWKKTPEGVHLVGWKGRIGGGLTAAQNERLDELEQRQIDRGPLPRQEHDEMIRLRGMERSTKVVDTTEKESVLSDAIGKSMADRIKSNPNQSGTIEGDDITVSSTGMSEFYDRIMVNVANDVLKKLGGGRVGEITIEMPAQESDPDSIIRTVDGHDVADQKQPGFSITPELIQRVEGGIPLFSKAGIAPLYSKAAADLGITPKMSADAFNGMLRQFQAGELPREQIFQAVTKMMDQAKVRNFTGEELIRATGEQAVNWFTRARMPFATGNYISKDSKGYENVAQVLLAQVQYKQRLISEGSTIGLSTWHTATQADREDVFDALMKRTVGGFLEGSKEYTNLRNLLTPEQLKLWNQAGKAVEQFLNMELAVDKKAFLQLMAPKLSALAEKGDADAVAVVAAVEADGNGKSGAMDALTPDQQSLVAETKEYRGWARGRREQVKNLIDNGYIPERRFGDNVVRIYVPMPDGTRALVSHEQFERKSGAVLAASTYQKEIDASGSGLIVEVTDHFKAEQDQGVSIQQFLDIARRNGIKLSQIDREKLSRSLIAADSVRRNRMMRRGNFPGFSKEGFRVLNEFVVTYANKIAHSAFSIAVNESLDGRPVDAFIDASGIPQIKVDYNKTGRNMERNHWVTDGAKAGFYHNYANSLAERVLIPAEGSSWSRKWKGLAMINFLGGSIGAGVVQTMAVPMNTLPWLSMHTPYQNAFAVTMSSWKASLANSIVLSDLEKLANPDMRIDAIDRIPGLREALLTAGKDGTTMDMEIFQIMGISQGGVLSQSRAVQKAMNVWMAPFKFGERTSRIASFIAGYRVGQENGLTGRDLYKFAKGVVDNTQNQFNEVNRPIIANHPVFSLMFMFRSFPLFMVEMLELMFRQNPKSAVYMLLGLTAMTGVQGLPFAELIEDIIDTISQNIFGSPFNVRRAMRNVFKDASEALVGVDMSELMLRGGLNDLLGVSMSSRVGLGDLIPGSRIGTADADYGRVVENLLGAPFSMAHSIAKNAGAFAGGLAKGDVDQVMAAVRAGGPTAFRNIIKGAEQMSNGYAEDAAGRKIVDTSTISGVFQSMGLTSAAVTKMYEADKIDRQTNAFYTQVGADMRNHLVRAAMKGDSEKIQEIYDAMRAWDEANPDMPLRRNPAAMRMEIMKAGMPLNERTLRFLPRVLRGTSVSAETLGR